MFYDIHIFCCVHKRPDGHRRGSCADKGSKLLCDLMCRRTMAQGFSRIRVNHAGCMNLCEYGPTMVIYPLGVWYRYETEQDVIDIINQHVKLGKPVERLLLDPAVVSLKH